METFFKLVLTSSLYASVVGIVILVLKVILKNKINPKWHYIIWTVLILKLLIPFGPESAISLFNTVPKMPDQTNFTQLYEEYHQNYETVRQSGDKTHIPTIWAVQDSSLHLAATTENALPYIWLVGVILMLGWLIFTNYSLKWRIKSSSLPVPESIDVILQDCKKKLGVKKCIRVVVQNTISTPSLFDVFNPKILLTSDVLKLSEKEISYILLHELAHYKRRDLIINYLLLLLQALHWFNPIIWYCFKRIRQDMEVAADEQVLALLEPVERKEYGKALLSILENLSFPRLAPRLIGMVDDKKNIEKRIKMIKMMDFFKNRRRTTLLIGVLCVAVLSGILLTNGLTKDNSTGEKGNESILVNGYNAVDLFKFKSAYVGDNSNVVNLLSTLPFGNLHREVSLKTSSRPYGISAKYDLSVSSLSIEAIEATFRKNSTVIFALIDNVDEISFDYGSVYEKRNYKCTREQIKKSYDKDLREYAKDVKEFETLINSFSLRLIAYPEKYMLTMSSTPGIRILAEYTGMADMVEYSTNSGKLLTWDSATGKISEHGQKVEMSLGMPVYWSPLVNGADKEANVITVNAVALNNKNILTQKKVNIKFDSATNFYMIIPSEDVIFADTATSQYQKPRNIEEAVSLAIKEQRKSYADGEAYTEGHIILDTEEKDGIIKAYTLASYGAFGFENGVFTKISGSGSIPTVITFRKNQNSEYLLIEYKEPMDGAGNIDSTKKMFPERLWDMVLNQKQDKYTILAKQQENQARQYLKSIGRNAEISEKYVDKQLAKIDVDASNKLFAGYTKNDVELNNFPYWIGTKELIQNGVRYIYETSQSKTDDGYDLIFFKKSKENGTIVKEYKYKIVGQEPQLIDQIVSTTKTSEADKERGLKIIKEYFDAFAKGDYKTMSSLATAYHNKELVHNGDVWGMKWAKAKEIEFVGNSKFLRIENPESTLVFGISVDMETAITSAQYPSNKTFFYVTLVKGEDGVWRVDRYTTG